MKNNVIFGMGIFHTANGLKVLRQAKINVRQMSRGDSSGCVIFKILWDNGAKTQPRQNTAYQCLAHPTENFSVKILKFADADANAIADAGGSTIALPGLRSGELKRVKTATENMQ